jgi:hypothetical protein
MTDRRPETQVLIEEGVRLGILLGLLLAAHNWQWIEHQIWKAATYRDRHKNEIRLAEQQVQKEISLMEHGQ